MTESNGRTTVLPRRCHGPLNLIIGNPLHARLAIGLHLVGERLAIVGKRLFVAAKMADEVLNHSARGGSVH